MTIKKLALWAGVSVWLAFISAAYSTKGFSQVPGIFSTISWTNANGASVGTNFAFVNGQPSSYAGTQGYTSYGKNATGDFDFVAANNGASPTFYWYYLLGTTPTIEMFLDAGANLHLPNSGIIAGTRIQGASLAATVYTVATLPSAVTAGQGSQVVVSDASSATVGSTCVGGGSTYMLALSNGTVWSCH